MKRIPNTAATRPAVLSTFLLSLLLLLQPLDAAAQLVIAGTDEYAQLIFDMQALDRTDGSPRPPAGTAEPSDFPEPGDSVPAPGTAATGLEERQSVAAIETAIDTALAESGLYSPRLREQYQALGQLQQRLGQHESAIATLEKSVHIARVNDGLFTPDQEADVQHIIESLMAVGDTEREIDYRSYLFYMQQRAYADDDPRLIAAKLAWADWNLHAYQRDSMINPRSMQLPGSDRPEELIVVRNTQNGEVRFVPRRLVMNNAALSGSLTETSRYSLTPEMVVDARLREAREVYEELLETRGDTMDPQQREALRLKLVAGEYAFKRHMDRLLGEADDRSALSGTIVAVDPMIMRRGFRESSELLEQEVVALEAASPADPLALATAYLRQADLNIAYEQRRDAETWYARTWAALLDAGFDEAAASAWLQPAPLLPVPDFAVHPYSRELFNIGVDDTLPHRGYIDVSLNLTRDGNVRRAEITAASEETPQRVRRLLLTYLRNQKMRPVLDKGTPVTQEGIELRFHYSY